MRGPFTLQSGLGLCSAGLGLMHLNLLAGPDFHQKFDVNINPNTSSVCYAPRPHICVPDNRWHTVEMECGPRSALVWSWADIVCISHLSRDSQVWRQYHAFSSSSAQKCSVWMAPRCHLLLVLKSWWKSSGPSSASRSTHGTATSFWMCSVLWGKNFSCIILLIFIVFIEEI